MIDWNKLFVYVTLVALVLLFGYAFISAYGEKVLAILIVGLAGWFAYESAFLAGKNKRKK